MTTEANVIFDFDGTIADSFLSALQKFNCLADEFGYRHIDDVEIESARNLSSHELIKFLRIPFYKLPRVLVRIREMMRDDILQIPLIPKMNTVVEALHGKGISLTILSSNSAENISKWLQLYNLQDYFSHIYEKSSFFGKSHSLNKLIHANAMNRSKTYYIGDETRDIEAARKCKIAAVAVTWGFSSESVLSRFHPDYVVNDPEELLKIVCERI